MNVRSIIIPTLTAMLLAAVFGRAGAAEDNAAGVLRFHRVFAPEDRIQDWPRGDAKYLPVDAAEFDRLVAAMQPRPIGDPTAPAAAIVSARYEAKLVEEQLVGRASINVILTGQAPASLPFEPCNLALENIVWSTAEMLPSPLGMRAGGEGNSETGRLGNIMLPLPSITPSPRENANQSLLLWPAAPTFGRPALGLAGSGKLEAMVDQSGQWQFDWSLAGRRDSTEILSFVLETPAAPAAQLSIELPKGFTPAIDRGMVVGSEPVGERTIRWQIEFGGCRRLRLRILPIGVVGQRPQLALLRELRTYDLSLRGVEVTAQWRLQVHNRPLQQVAVLLDPELQLVSARYGDAFLTWSATQAAPGQATRVVLALPEPIRDTERVIRLTALGKPRLDQPWRLPRIRGEGLFWQEGNISLLTAEPLVANRIVPIGCEQTAVGPLSAPRTGESIQFQSFEPAATVEVLISRPAAPSRLAAAGTAAKLNGNSKAVPPTAAKRNDIPSLNPQQISSCHLESWYLNNGTARHEATYDLQNASRGSLPLTLPPDVARESIRDVRIDGKPVEWRWAATKDASCIVVNLPAKQKSPRVTIEWTVSGQPLGIVGSLTPSLPESDLPMPRCRWTAWLPPGYESRDKALTWNRRLVGPLGGPEGANRFDPLSASNWMSPLVEFRRQTVDDGAMPSEAIDTQGWTAWRTEFFAETPVTLNVVHGPSMQLLGLIELLLTVALGCWKAGRRPVLLVLLLGVFGAAAMLSPAAYAPLASASYSDSSFASYGNGSIAKFRRRSPREHRPAVCRRLAARLPWPCRLA